MSVRIHAVPAVVVALLLPLVSSAAEPEIVPLVTDSGAGIGSAADTRAEIVRWKAPLFRRSRPRPPEHGVVLQSVVDVVGGLKEAPDGGSPARAGGLLWAIGARRWQMEVDVLYSRGSRKNDRRVSTFEIGFGPRRQFFPRSVVTFDAGSGLAIGGLQARVAYYDEGRVEDSTIGLGVGLWVGGGISVRWRAVRAGAHVRYSVVPTNATAGDARFANSGGAFVGARAGIAFGR